MIKRDIPYYKDFISDAFLSALLKGGSSIKDIPDLVHVGEMGGLESIDSLKFLCELYDLLKNDLNTVLNNRITDRIFIDQQTKATAQFNHDLKRDFLSSDYKTIIGNLDSNGRVVIGPLSEFYSKAGVSKPIATIPDHLKGNHVTLFGPPDDTKLSINAMNAYHRKLNGEPAIVEELLKTQNDNPFWGADDEDSKTPLRSDLISAGLNLTECFDGTIAHTDARTKKEYKLENDHLSLPIKRFPGLALPSFFLFYKNNPIPLHMYDFALHLFKNWHNEKALAFYVPKLENEEEARYIKLMLETAEKLIQKRHPEYKLGTIRLMIVLENPRAIFRVNEIMDELYPYFVGASLGWHDFLASTARLFKEDSNYRIPVKADPNIVIKYIKASHNLLADVVGSRGGIKVGGMYGILPTTTDLRSESFQVTMKGYFKDVITQFKRNLNGFWVAHPDFVRIGLALVEAWRQYKEGDRKKLEELVFNLLDSKYHKEMLDFIFGPDIEGLNINDPLYARSLIVADIKESTYIANNHPDEIRYNVFQSLQYITDWLSGNGCVALPASIDGIAVRVMDDLATAERSRWEVWHELNHGRFSIEDFLTIAHEELHFIRKDLSDNKKIVQVKWDDRTAKWYPVAFNLMVKLMTDKKPCEFATELLLPFTIPSIRESNNPWEEVLKWDAEKFAIDSKVIRYNYYFSLCGAKRFASSQSNNLALDVDSARKCILSFSKSEILEAAHFHGDIGENKKTLDAMAAGEQASVNQSNLEAMAKLNSKGIEYKEKFKMKFLVSAKGKSESELLSILEERIKNSEILEIENAKQELWLITKKRFDSEPINHLYERLKNIFARHKVIDAQIALSTGLDSVQSLNFGSAKTETLFEIASLSKSFASAFAISYFNEKRISLETSVNSLLEKTNSTFRLVHPEWGNQVSIAHLMGHCALNMHYVNGVPLDEEMPSINNFLYGNEKYGYVPVEVINTPGSTFQYSGAGFIVLEHLIEALSGKSIKDLTEDFLKRMDLTHFTFEQKNRDGFHYIDGIKENGKKLEERRKMFPAFAAGSMSNALDVTTFLQHLTKAYSDINGSTSISHDVARLMLFGKDLGAMKFMGALMGLGIFIAEAGDNKLVIHQGANDGFRALFVHCVQGPDRGLGFTILSNGELNAVSAISECAQEIFKAFNFSGIDYSKFQNQFKTDSLKQEEIVNIGYKNLVFSAFMPMLPEKIIEVGPCDPHCEFNLALHAEIIETTNQKFARAENLFSEFLPVFDPNLFGKQGKIMDSWETVRHNKLGVDTVVFKLKRPSTVKYVSISTKFHFGNQAEFTRLEGWNENKKEWIEILSKTKLDGHALKNVKADGDSESSYSLLRLSNFPDGGISRLSLYDEKLANFQEQNEVFKDEIPKTLKPLAAPYSADKNEIDKNWSRLNKGDEVDVASLAFGGKLIKASNEHYGPAIQTISPFAPMNMFDGLESARSRKIGHFEEAHIALAKSCVVYKVQLDFTFFVNNNPFEVSLLGLSSGEWKTLAEKVLVKPFAGSKKEILIDSPTEIEEVKLLVYPDGGVNRLRIFSIV